MEIPHKGLVCLKQTSLHHLATKEVVEMAAGWQLTFHASGMGQLIKAGQQPQDVANLFQKQLIQMGEELFIQEPGRDPVSFNFQEEELYYQLSGTCWVKVYKGSWSVAKLHFCLQDLSQALPLEGSRRQSSRCFGVQSKKRFHSHRHFRWAKQA